MMADALRRFGFEPAMLGLLAAGWWWQIDGAQHLLRFVVWALLPVALFAAISQQVIGSMSKAPARSTLRTALNFAVWLLMLGVLAWHGNYATAAAALLVIVFSLAHSAQVRSLRAARSAA